MKKVVALCAGLALAITAAGRDVRVWYDNDHNPVKKSKAKYYCVFTAQSDSTYRGKEYLKQGDTLLSEGTYSRPDHEARDGHFTFYSRGSKWEDGDYVAGKREGRWKIYFAGTSLVCFQCDYHDDKLNGSCERYLRNGQLRYRDTYKDDSLIATVGYNMAGDQVADYHKVLIMPHAPYNVGNFIVEHMEYPDEARKKHLMGKVLVTFWVDEDGNINDVKAITHLGSGCEEEAERVVRLMPPWRPGVEDDAAVPVFYTLPIHFRLQ